MDRFDAMRVFLATVEAGSLSAAARKLKHPLATVSRQVAGLETRLKAPLLIRTSRRTELTEAGRGFAVEARRILEELDDAERAAAGEYTAPRGGLAISAPLILGVRHVAPVATAFLAAHPDIDLTLQLVDRPVNLVEEHIDAAIRIGPLTDQGMIQSRIGVMRRVTVAAPAYLARHGAPKAPRDLGRHACISFDGARRADRWRFEGADAAVRFRLSVNNAQAAVDAATAGLGIARVLSYQAYEAVRARKLTVILAKFEPPPLPVSLIYPGHGTLPLKLRAFLDWAGPRLRARLVKHTLA
ncbi:MAG TPA: LysR family transcriptional regulator [Rhizomicrobium sp.]|jgi:DNA-binding transcriptional LysR family regulator